MPYVLLAGRPAPASHAWTRSILWVAAAAAACLPPCSPSGASPMHAWTAEHRRSLALFCFSAPVYCCWSPRAHPWRQPETEPPAPSNMRATTTATRPLTTGGSARRLLASTELISSPSLINQFHKTSQGIAGVWLHAVRLPRLRQACMHGLGSRRQAMQRPFLRFLLCLRAVRQESPTASFSYLLLGRPPIDGTLLGVVRRTGSSQGLVTGPNVIHA